MLLELRPSIINPELWYPDRSDRRTWDKVRQATLKKWGHTCQYCGHRALKHMHVHHLHLNRKKRVDLIPICIACHAVLHLGLNLMYGAVEVWKSRIGQREIVRRTRQGIQEGKSLSQVKKTLPDPLASPCAFDHSVDSLGHLNRQVEAVLSLCGRQRVCATAQLVSRSW
jgi:hypothetical protein